MRKALEEGPSQASLLHEGLVPDQDDCRSSCMLIRSRFSVIMIGDPQRGMLFIRLVGLGTLISTENTIFSS